MNQKYKREYSNIINSTIYYKPILKKKAVNSINPLKKFIRVLDEDFPREKYYRRTKEVKHFIHWGQRKLLLGEIEFFTLYLQNNSIENITCIYAGAAPGTHIILLSKLFPNINFILYDPRDFSEELIEYSKDNNIEIFQEYFTDETAYNLSNLDSNILFISDIRTANIETMNQEEIEECVKSDHVMQKNWYDIIKPKMTMLKFRLPWDDNITSYIDGEIYLQCYAPLSSTETRLVINNYTSHLKSYDNKKYEEQLFYFNKYCRETEYENPLSKLNTLNKNGLTNKYDSICEIYIISKLLELYNSIEIIPNLENIPNSHIECIIWMSKYIDTTLSNTRTLSSEQPLNNNKKKMFYTAKENNLIPDDIYPTVSNYNKYVIPIYDEVENLLNYSEIL